MTLRIGLASGSLFPDYPTEHVFATARSLDVDDVEIMPQTQGEYQEPFFRILAE